MTRKKLPKKPPVLETDAWLLLGISSVPGELSLQEDRLLFVAHHTGTAWPWQLRRLERRVVRPGIAKAIDAGKKTKVFDWPVQEVQAWSPWYYFGGGIKLKRSDLVLRFSFGRPANTTARGRHLNAGDALGDAAANLGEIKTMRSAGRLWQEALKQVSKAAPGGA